MGDAGALEDKSWETQSFLNLKKLLTKEQYSKALELCNKILVKLPDDADALKAKVICLIHLTKFSSALEIALKNDAMKFECAYCYYRLNDLKKSLEICQSFTIPKPEKVLHLQAQTQYKMAQYEEATSCYEHLTSKKPDGDVDMEVMCNIYASHVASGQPNEVLSNYDIDEHSERYETNFEVYYNRACAYISLGEYQRAMEDLVLAKDICVKVLREEGAGEEEVEKECRTLNLQIAYLNIVTGKTADTLEVCRNILKSQEGLKGAAKDLELMAVAANNLAVLRGDRDLPDSLRRLRTTITGAAEGKLSPSQLRELRFNRCVLLLHLKKFDEALKTLDELETQYGSEAVRNRAAIIRATILAFQRKWTESEALINAALQHKSQSKDGKRASDVTPVELQLFKVQLLIAKEEFTEAVGLLSSIEVLKHHPASISALYQLNKLGHPEQQTDRLDSLCRDVREAVAKAGDGLSESGVKTLLSRASEELEAGGKYTQAAQLQQLLLNSGTLGQEERIRVMSKMAILFSHQQAEGDREAAERIVSSIPVPTLNMEIKTEELENKDIPRLRTGKVAKSSVTTEAAVAKGRGMTTEQKTRKKARRREKYLLKLQTIGKYDPTRPIKPDPERWIPRNQRSYAKKGRKNRNKFVGGQGSGDGAQKDMVKLDAFARAQAKKEEDAKLAEEAKTKEASKGTSKGRRKR